MASDGFYTPSGYKIQSIYYLNKRTHRIQQNVGGACPLLALCNTLFLNHQIHYTKAGRRIKFEDLTDCLTQHLHKLLHVDSVDGQKVKTELKVDKHKDTDHKNDPLQQIQTKKEEEAKEEAPTAEMQSKLKIIQECEQLFPKLEEGLDINIKFSDGCDFEENLGYRMFAHYGFKIFHGWVIDPKEEQLYKLIGDKSYDEMIDFLISDPPNTANEEEKKQMEDNKDIVRKFIAESATQLTSYGLERLYTLMEEEDVLAIFFRNNHFSTIVKHDGIMYEFVTDEGIIEADPQITWQQISGSEKFVNNKFQSIYQNFKQDTKIAHYNRIRFQQVHVYMVIVIAVLCYLVMIVYGLVYEL